MPDDVGGLLRDVAKEQPTLGIRFRTGGPTDAGSWMSYPELLDQALVWLAGLRAAGAGAGDRVVLLLDRPEEFIPLFWAAMSGAMTVCPVPSTASAESIGHVDELLGRPLFVVRDQRLPGIRSVALSELGGGDPAVPTVAAPDDVALLVLTSGSTGRPKAVVLRQSAVLAGVAASAAALELGPDDVVLNWLALDHVAALSETHLLPMAARAGQVQTTPGQVSADPMWFLEVISRERVTMAFTPNFLLGLLNRVEPGPGLDLSSLRLLVSGGEANPVPTALTFLDQFASAGLRRDALCPAFGMTEIMAGGLYNRTFPERGADGEFAAVGQPVPGLALRLSEDGELHLRGSMLTSGYLGDPRANADAFTADGWFRTGDLARVDGDMVTLVGRARENIIVNSVRYYSHDLESVLERIDGVDSSFIAVFPVRYPGDDTERLTIAFASTLPADDEAGRHRQLVTIRDTATLHWGFRPSIILVLPRSAFVKTSLGKIQRRALRAAVEEGRFAAEQASADALLTLGRPEYVPPAGAGEKAVADLFAGLFGLPRGEVGALTSFLDLGGTSLDTLTLKGSLRAVAPHTELSLSTILAAPTVRGLAAMLDVEAVAAYDPVVTLQAGGTGAPLFFIHPGTGEILGYVHLARHFAGERPFHALRARGFGPKERPFDTLAELVDCYTEAIRAVRPDGPYLLAGYSFGGIVAFEVAKRLEQQGQTIAFLGLVDIPPHVGPWLGALDPTRSAIILTLFLELVDRNTADGLPAQLDGLPRDQVLAALYAACSPARLSDLDLDLGRFAAWADLTYALTSLGATYVPTGTVGTTTVFQARPLTGTRDEWTRQLASWRDHSRDHTELIHVAGEHYTVMAPRHLIGFQAAFKTALATALRRHRE
ncbi:alpha/beta fold hydrolase [Dactylosporangium sp. CS-047395]|uniref:alpha/beta fold hydrolase n=1 Tax=Dactylosporangium sp. CS-047395 TaxID=3239936 RepID=UPI003D8AA144